MFPDTALPTELIQAFVQTHYRVHPDGPLAPSMTLRVGHASAGLAALHQAHGVDCSAFITAYNPFARKVEEGSNLQRQQALEQELGSRRLDILRGEGQHPTNGWPAEPSVLVLGLSLEAARDMGRRYEQAAIVWIGPAGVPELVLLQ